MNYDLVYLHSTSVYQGCVAKTKSKFFKKLATQASEYKEYNNFNFVN